MSVFLNVCSEVPSRDLTQSEEKSRVNCVFVFVFVFVCVYQ